MQNRQIEADLVRLTTRAIDIKLVIDGDMHILQWRRRFLRDEVLVDGRRQHETIGLFGKEKMFGLIFGADEEGQGGERMLFTVDPEDGDWSGMTERAAGVRLESAHGVLIAHGTLDPKNYEKPKNFNEFIRKNFGMEW